MTPPLVIALLAPALLVPRATPGASHELAAAAAASGRPAECAPAGANATATLWQRARAPSAVEYCILLARSHARMAEDPTVAHRAAEKASELSPGRAAPYVAMARAELREGETVAAEEHFARALELDPDAIEQPLAVLDHARTLRLRGRPAEALAAYRKLAPRSTLLPSRDERARALVEAALLAMAVGGGVAGPPAPGGLDEALAYLREASRDPNQSHRQTVALVLALALDRRGDHAQADAVIAQLADAARLLPALKDVTVGDDGEAFALRALAVERSDRAAAVAAWRSFLGTPLGRGPWGQVAQSRIASLEGTPGGRRRGGP